MHSASRGKNEKVVDNTRSDVWRVAANIIPKTTTAHMQPLPKRQ